MQAQSKDKHSQSTTRHNCARSTHRATSWPEAKDGIRLLLALGLLDVTVFRLLLLLELLDVTVSQPLLLLELLDVTVFQLLLVLGLLDVTVLWLLLLLLGFVL